MNIFLVNGPAEAAAVAKVRRRAYLDFSLL